MFSGCVSSWPANLPPESYSGVVLSQARHRPEADATVLAVRPREDLDFYPKSLWPVPYAARDESIGRAQSDSAGSFTIRTTGGYATKLFTASADGWQEGYLKHVPKRGGNCGVIVLDPAPRAISYTRVALGDRDCARLSLAFGRMVAAYLSTNRRRALSFDGYVRAGVLTPDEYAFLSSLRPHLVGRHSDIRMEFSRCVVRIDAWDMPVRFVPRADPFPRAGLAKESL